MKKLVNCKSCAKPVGLGALTCPNCGELHPSIRLGRAFAWLFGVLVMFGIAVAILSGPTAEVYKSLSPQERVCVQGTLCSSSTTREAKIGYIAAICGTSSHEEAVAVFDQAEKDFEAGGFKCED